MLWFSPKLPVSDTVRAWVDGSMDRLIELFDREALNGPIALPTEEFFPDDWDGSSAALAPFFLRVCKQMGVDPAVLTVQIVDDRPSEADAALTKLLPSRETSRKGAAGEYRADANGKILIRLMRSQFRDLTSVIAVMAHELAHVQLLAEGRISHDEENMEPLTDLLTVFLGMGIFTANSAEKYSQVAMGRRYKWSIQRLGYLPQPAFGYALAKYAQLRGEKNPVWSKHLVLNVREYFKQSLRVLENEAQY